VLDSNRQRNLSFFLLDLAEFVLMLGKNN